jgi:hypothetical protein
MGLIPLEHGAMLFISLGVTTEVKKLHEGILGVDRASLSHDATNGYEEGGLAWIVTSSPTSRVIKRRMT